MTRMLIAVLALSAMGYLAYRAMYASSSPGSLEGEAPKQRLENVQKAANSAEQKDQQRADDVEQKMKTE